MLFPKKFKYKKYFKGKIKINLKKKNFINFGEYALKALEPGRISSRQIEAARKAMIRRMKRLGKLWIKIFPNIPITKKPIEIRMGKGKGSVDFWISKINKEQIIFEIGGVSKDIALYALYAGKNKLPIKTKIILLKGL